MFHFRGDTRAARIQSHRCFKCGIGKATAPRVICDPCLENQRTKYREKRQRDLDAARRAQEEAEKRRLRACREVTISGQTFVVVNSYVTVSSTLRVQQAPHPFLK